jgi:hypothetical protein
MGSGKNTPPIKSLSLASLTIRVVIAGTEEASDLWMVDFPEK